MEHPYSFKWYALQLKPLCERRTAAILSNKGYEEFLPLYRVRRRWSDRVKEIETPVFPGYMFCRFDVNNRLPILMTPGVIKVVGVGNVPVAVEDAEIDAIRRVVSSNTPFQPCPFPKAGEEVEIQSGPLFGVRGIVVRANKKRRLIVSVSLLQRSVMVETDAQWVRTVSVHRCPQSQHLSA